MIKKLIFFVAIVFFVSCAEDESPIQKNEKRVEISSFLIVENTETGVKTKANLKIEGFDSFSFQNHGVLVHHNGSLIKKIEQGELSKNSFESIIRSGVVKGNTYTVFPYVFVENKFVYGDTLDFTSNVDIKINVKEIKPLNGFVYDTISIIGENFCKSLADTPTRFLLNNNFQSVIFESDSLIKAIITTNINASKLTPTVRNCGLDTIIPNIFKINPPILDSLSSVETYVGENSFAYGENFHSHISNIWINDIEASLNKQRLDIDKLEFTIPEGLPAGLLNLKIKVLDTIIEKQNYYKSTSPIITSLDKKDTGFLDTLTIRGNYLKQKYGPTKVFVGGKEQKILELSDEEIKIVINKYFSDNSSKLLLKTGSFELEENLNMLPPEIISFDKDTYHLDNDFVTFKTKYFIAGSSYNINVGGVTLRSSSYNFNDVDENGNITLSMYDWLEARPLRYPNFIFSEIGKLKVEIKTQFGTSEKNINIFPPKIESIAKNSLYVNTHTDFIELSGLDFGYGRVSSVYIDDELVNNPGTSAYSVYNKEIKFQIPENVAPGDHVLKVQTGGQLSNEISFNVKEITTSGLTKNSGIRELDIFTINGNNLENKYSYAIKVNGILCDIVSTSNKQVQFTIPYHTALRSNMPVTLEYGLEVINVGFINGLETYFKLENYQVPSDYYRNSSYFEFQGKLYFLNRHGIYLFELGSQSWIKFESNTPFPDGYTDIRSKFYISEVGDKIYIPYGNKFHIYNMIQKVWEEPMTLSLGDNFNFANAFVDSNLNAYLFRGVNFGDYTYVKYNLNNHTIEELPQPNFTVTASNLNVFYHHNGKVYIDVRDQNINVFDIQTNTWQDIGFPRDSKFFYANKLYVYNNTLYFSGGQGNTGIEFNLFAYDLNTKIWKKKMPMLLKLESHAVWGNDGYLYFGLGNHTYSSYDNYEMLKYDIDKDTL